MPNAISCRIQICIEPLSRTGTPLPRRISFKKSPTAFGGCGTSKSDSHYRGKANHPSRTKSNGTDPNRTNPKQHHRRMPKHFFSHAFFGSATVSSTPPFRPTSTPFVRIIVQRRNARNFVRTNINATIVHNGIMYNGVMHHALCIALIMDAVTALRNTEFRASVVTEFCMFSQAY